MSGTFNAAVGDVGTFFNRATDEGQIFQNPLTDIGIGSAVLLPFLAPEILPGLASLFSGAGEAAIPDALSSLGSTGASALGFAGDVGAGTAADTGALAGIDSALTPGATLLTGAGGGPLLNITPAIGPPLDLLAGGAAEGTALGAPLDLLAEGGGAGAADLGAYGAAGAGTAGLGVGGASPGLGNLLGATALASNLSNLGGSSGGGVPGVSGPGAAPATTGGGVSAGGAPTAGGGGATGGAGGDAAGGSAAANAAPVAGSTSSDALAFSGAPVNGSPNIPGFPSYSSTGQPLSATATDPTVIAGAGTSGGYDLGTIGPGVSSTGGALGDNAPLSLGGLGSGASGLLGGAGSWIANNPLMAAALGLGGGELINNVFNKPKLPYQQQQEQIASEAQSAAASNTALGKQYLSYQTNGTLPPGMQAQVTQALNDAIAASNSKYASMGLANSTMAQQEQQYLTLQSQALAGQLQQQLAQTGTQLISDATSDLSVASQVYSALMETQISQDTALEQSVTQFAGSLALASVVGGKTGTLKAAA